MAELNYYKKDMEKIQKKLLKRIDSVLQGLVVLNDEQLATAFREIDFVDELNKLGFANLLEKIRKSYNKQAVKSFNVLDAAQKTKQTVTAVQAIEVLSILDLTTISAGVTRYANEIKTAMFRGLLTGQSSQSIMEGLTQTYGVGKALSSNQQVALLNDSFARFNRTTTAKLFEDIPEQKFRYVGTLDSKTRDECRNTLALSQKEFTMEEINDLTTGVSFADGGGFNCRHEWIPV